MLQELEYELAAAFELAPRRMVIIRRKRGAYGEMEAEPFDPSPPPRGTTILGRFAFASAALTAAHRTIINRIAADVVGRIPGLPALHCVFVEAEGHEDEVGDPVAFGKFGLDRATAVATALAARIEALTRGTPPPPSPRVVIEVSTAGPTRPIRSNVTEDGRSQNRRVEVRIRVEPCGPIA